MYFVTSQVLIFISMYCVVYRIAHLRQFCFVFRNYCTNWACVIYLRCILWQQILYNSKLCIKGLCLMFLWTAVLWLQNHDVHVRCTTIGLICIIEDVDSFSHNMSVASVKTKAACANNVISIRRLYLCNVLTGCTCTKFSCLYCLTISL